MCVNIIWPHPKWQLEYISILAIGRVVLNLNRAAIVYILYIYICRRNVRFTTGLLFSGLQWWSSTLHACEHRNCWACCIAVPQTNYFLFYFHSSFSYEVHAQCLFETMDFCIEQKHTKSDRWTVVIFVHVYHVGDYAILLMQNDWWESHSQFHCTVCARMILLWWDDYLCVVWFHSFKQMNYMFRVPISLRRPHVRNCRRMEKLVVLLHDHFVG